MFAPGALGIGRLLDIGAIPVAISSGVFDGAGRLASQSGAGYTSDNSASYTYDPDTGLLAYASLPFPAALGGTVTEGTSSAPLTYDGNQRLTAATVNGVAGSYTYDGAGNLKTDQEGSTSTSFTYNGSNQLTQSVTGAATTVYGWDATNAWRTSQGPSANPTQIAYAYNAQGRLCSYTNSATGVSATYTYDATGQRTQSAVTAGGTTATTTWVYDGLTLMSQQVVSGASSWRVDYLYNEEGMPIGGVYRSPATSTSPVFFAIITNSRGDVCELLDSGGNAFAAYHYDAWGLPQGVGNYATGIWTASTSLISSTLAGQIASEQVLRYAGYAYDSRAASTTARRGTMIPPPGSGPRPTRPRPTARRAPISTAAVIRSTPSTRRVARRLSALTSMDGTTMTPRIVAS